MCGVDFGLQRILHLDQVVVFLPFFYVHGKHILYAYVSAGFRVRRKGLDTQAIIRKKKTGGNLRTPNNFFSLRF